MLLGWSGIPAATAVLRLGASTGSTSGLLPGMRISNRSVVTKGGNSNSTLAAIVRHRSVDFDARGSAPLVVDFSQGAEDPTSKEGTQDFLAFKQGKDASESQNFAAVDASVRRFLAGLLLIASLNGLFTLGRAFSFAHAGLRAARNTHRLLLAAVLGAPMSFFDTVPAGRILNRYAWLTTGGGRGGCGQRATTSGSCWRQFCMYPCCSLTHCRQNI